MLSFSTASAASSADGPQVTHVPEPMVFDLVRGLGARKGELELNTLGVTDLSTGDIDWAPEIEYAPIDNLAFEFEVPVVNAHVHALKFAAQVTFGRADRRLLHGAQAIVEVLTDGGVEATGLYLYAAQLNDSLSLMGMTGLRLHEGPHHPRAAEFLQNTTLFAQLSDAVVLGVESNLAALPGRPVELLLMPQTHLAITPHLKLQVGVGVLHHSGHPNLRQAARLIIER